ncbi:MAG TPA: hypothetical protein VN841_20365 [Bryobacteraceae bacterium]|nr:hypothetical protein [Bryobacteraceae bacterium]
MSGGFDTEVLLAVAYAVFLAAVTAGLELAARHSHHRSERMRVAGFRYDPKLDLWTCPNDQKLLRAEMDFGRRVVVYRAQAHACNVCAMKSRCTDSDEGRTIEHAGDSWLRSELRHFHRGMSLALLLLAVVILAAEFVRHPGRSERLVLAGMAAAMLAIGIRLLAAFIDQPRRLSYNLETPDEPRM